MKTQPNISKTGDMQGTSTADRAFKDQNDVQKQKGISNSGGQRSDQTSGKNSVHKPERKMPLL